MDLTKKKCGPCRGDVPPLGAKAAKERHALIPGWTLSARADRLSREYVFKDFAQAMAFVNRVAALAEEEGHHPDFVIHYNKVGLVIWTHKIGGLHENDFILAAKIGPLA